MGKNIQKVKDKNYIELLKQEAEFWAKETTGYDYRIPCKKANPQAVWDDTEIESFVVRPIYDSMIQEIITRGGKSAELGCGVGWFCLEVARSGGKIKGYDISEKLIETGSSYYKKRKEIEGFTGTIEYEIADLNFLELASNAFDTVICLGILHHCIRLDFILKQIAETMHNSKGVLICYDHIGLGRCENLVIKFLLFLLPTDLSYKEKISKIRNKLFKTHKLPDSHQPLSSQSVSPFEDIAGKELVPKIFRQLNVLQYHSLFSFIMKVAGRIRFRNRKLTIFFVRFLFLMDYLSISLGILKGEYFFLKASSKCRL